MLSKEVIRKELEERKEYLKGDNIQECEREEVEAQIYVLGWVLNGEEEHGITG